MEIVSKDKLYINSTIGNQHSVKAKFYEIIDKAHTIGVTFDDLDNILYKYKLNKKFKIKNNKSTQTNKSMYSDWQPEY